MKLKKTIKQNIVFLSIFSLVSILTGCGGGSSPSPTPPPPSKIPKTTAVTPIAPLTPVPQPPIIPPPVTNQAILRVVHFNTVKGVATPDANFIDSDTAKVEKRGLLNLYFDVNREADKTYHIDTESNGLAYFRVTTTKNSGSKLIHNFMGVVPGNYMTFDTKDAPSPPPQNPLQSCKNISIRMTNLPTINANARIMVNGHDLTGTIIEQNRGYIPVLPQDACFRV